MNLSGYYERIQKCCKCCRIYYADYIIDENVMLENLAKNLSQDELDWLLQNHTELCLRVNHHLFEYDDLARSVFFKSKKRGLAVKIYKIAQSFCKSGMDYAFLAIAIHKSLRAKKWCKELLTMAENNIKDGLCLINMLNFIEIKVLCGQKAENFLQNALTTTNFKVDFYLTMALELKQIGGFDEFAYKFYKKCIEKDRRDYYLSYARAFIKDKDELKALGIKPKLKEQKEVVASKAHKSKDEYLSELRNTSDFYKFYDVLDDMAEEFGKKRWILELFKDGEIYAKTAADYAYIASDVMDDFKDKIYARELLAKAVELLPDPDETFFVLDIIKKLGDKALLATACKKLLNLSDSIYMEVAGYLKDVDPNLAKECAVKAVENAKTRTEILYAATDVLEIFKDKGWAIEIVKNGIIDVLQIKFKGDVVEKFYERNFYVYENNESEARDFLEEVIKNFIKENFKINEVWNDYPFLTNEKQSFSALAPAIHKLTGVIWLEQPFKRVNKRARQETGNDETQRFIDLATMYGDNNAMYLFEVKHGWHNFYSNNFSQDDRIIWLKAIEQISHLTFQNLSVYERKNTVFYKIAFMIVPSYLTYDKSEKCQNDKFPGASENAQRLFDELKFAKSQMPNFVMSYKLDTSRHFERYEQIFPFLNFIIRVEKFGKNIKNN